MKTIGDLLREHLSDRSADRLRVLKNQFLHWRAVEGMREWLLETKAVRSIPKLYLRLLTQQIGYPDPELHLLSSLCDENKCSVDIGAYVGDYAFHMLRHSKRCHVFEPRPKAIERIKERLGATSLPLTLHAVALSDSEGEMPLRVAPECTERSTLETGNPLENFEEQHTTVSVRRLDNCDLGEIGCIKIDVEGHEEAVVKGGMQTIRRDRPSLIIEAEERHNPGTIGRLTSVLRPLGYEGYFLKDGGLRPLDSFDVHEHQISILEGKYIDNKKKYINNFIFMCEKHSTQRNN
jgi:FkbM family methyltransferase